MRYFFLVFTLVTSFLHAGVINIAVASNVNYAMQTLKKEFEQQHPKTEVNITLGSSGKLTAQIIHGAPFGLFMSANMFFPQALYKKNLTLSKPIVYAEGALVYFSKKQEDFSKGLELLKSPHIKRVAIANPKTAPYGKATKEALENAKLYSLIHSKFVYGESVSQTLSYTLRATDIGFIAKSALFCKELSAYKKGVHWEDVDAKLYTPIKQGMVILKNAKNIQEVKFFYDYILSDDAKKILTAYGYRVQ